MVTNKDKMDIAMKAYNLIFQSKAVNSDITQVELVHPAVMGGRCRGRWFKNSVTGQATLRGFDITVGNMTNELINVRIIEQNPNKNSQYASMARAGSKIAWIINRDTDQFTGRIQDGAFYPSRTPAYRQVQPSTVNQNQVNSPAQMGTALPANMDKLPEVDEAGIPDFVVNYFSTLEE